MARIVRLTDNVLLGLARTRNVRARLPAFKILFDALGRRGCGRCRKRNVRRQRDVLLSLKKAIVENGSMIRTLKQIIKADGLEIYVPNGKVVQKRVL